MNVISTCSLPACGIPPAAAWPTGRRGKPTLAANAAGAARSPTGPPTPDRPLQRLRDVRRREGITRRTVARRLNVPVSQVAQQEEPTADLRLSDLYRWKEALAVPVTELIEEPNGVLSPPVLLRVRLLRAMKSVRSIEAGARQASIRGLAAMLADELIAIMPELAGATGWPAVTCQPAEAVELFQWHLPHERRWS